MRFGEHISAHITPEWRKQYISYEAMKEKLYEAVEEAPSSEMSSNELVEHHFAKFDEDFFLFCNKELLKINTFFAEKMAEATRRFAALESELAALEKHKQESNKNSDHKTKRKVGDIFKARSEEKTPHRSMNEIKLGLSEFYLSIILLQNYQSLNFTGFRKILKKHDKLLKTERGAVWRQTYVEVAPFYTSKEVDQLIKETENIFTIQLEGGDRSRAMKRLRVPPLGEKQNPFTTFRVGFFSGIFIVLLIIISIAAYETRDAHEGDWEAALRLFRGTFLVYFFIFLLGINTYGWRTSGVNQILIFELDPRNHLTHQQFIEVSSFFFVIWSISVIGFLLSHYINAPPFICPLLLIIISILSLLCPFRILYHKARFWLLRVLFRILTAPFHYVGFADFWLADQLNSLTIVLLDLQYSICFFSIDIRWNENITGDSCNGLMYGITPIVACLPAWFRFAQCLRRYKTTGNAFPHIANAGKYATSFFIVIFLTLFSIYYSKTDVVEHNIFFYLYILSALIGTCYTYAWDIKMDWGLLDIKVKENKLLREEIVYSRKAYYYFAIIQDLILRLTWIISLTMNTKNIINNEVLRTVLAFFEVIRRFIWNFFRLENEHLNNCGQFRAVRDISIVPISTNDQALLEKMMDEEDGVTNRRPKKFQNNPLKVKVSEKTPLLKKFDEAKPMKIDNDFVLYSQHT